MNIESVYQTNLNRYLAIFEKIAKEISLTYKKKFPSKGVQIFDSKLDDRIAKLKDIKSRIYIRISTIRSNLRYIEADKSSNLKTYNYHWLADGKQLIGFVILSKKGKFFPKIGKVIHSYGDNDALVHVMFELSGVDTLEEALIAFDETTCKELSHIFTNPCKPGFFGMLFLSSITNAKITKFSTFWMNVYYNGSVGYPRPYRHFPEAPFNKSSKPAYQVKVNLKVVASEGE